MPDIVASRPAVAAPSDEAGRSARPWRRRVGSAFLTAAGVFILLGAWDELAFEKEHGFWTERLAVVLAEPGAEARRETAEGFEALVAQRPRHPAPYRGLAESLSGPAVAMHDGGAGPEGGTLEPLSRADLLRGAEALRRSLRIDPFSAPGHVLLATLLFRLDEEAVAEKELRRALEAAPRHPGILSQVVDHTLYRAYETGSDAALDEARTLIRRLAELAPESLQHLLPTLAVFGDGAEELQSVVPESWESLYQYARYLTEQGQWAEGMAAFRRAAALAEDRADFLMHATVDFGRHLAKRGHWPEALTTLEEASLLNEGRSPEPLLFARVLMHNDRLDEAEAIYLEQLKRGRERQEVLAQVFRSFEESDRVADAVPFLERVTQDVPFFYAPLYWLGRAHMDLGNDNEAISVLERFVQYDRQPEAFESLYRLMARSGRWRAATGYIRTALIYSPGNEEYMSLLREAEQRMRSSG